jgi:hypothetical protein
MTRILERKSLLHTGHTLPMQKSLTAVSAPTAWARLRWCRALTTECQAKPAHYAQVLVVLAPPFQGPQERVRKLRKFVRKEQ